MSENNRKGGYYGKFIFGGELIAAGKSIGGAMSLYGRDGEFHYKPEYDKWYYEGDFDEISDEEFEKFKAKRDAERLKEENMEVKRYFRDHDHDDWIVRVWVDKEGNRHGEMWSFRDKEWFEAPKTAWNVAEEIYENHPLTEAMVEEITGVKPERVKKAQM